MKVIAFDLGNVLFGFDYGIALEKIRSKIKASPQEVITELHENNFALDFERGLVEPREFYAAFARRFKAALSYAEFADIWCDLFFPHPEVIDLAPKLSALYTLHLISNINVLHFEFLRQRYPGVFGLFRDLILSYQVKAVKPEEEIYAALRKAAGTAFEDIVYIDDRHDLIVEARKFKLQCLRFNHVAGLIEGLAGMGIRVGE